MLYEQSSQKARESTALYVVIPKSLQATIAASGFIKGDSGRSYVGLRESPEQAFERARLINPDVQPEECMVCAVRFTPLGWMHCTTKMQGTVPMLHKKIYQHHLDWETWHFNAAIPVEMHDVNTSQGLLKVIFHEF